MVLSLPAVPAALCEHLEIGYSVDASLPLLNFAILHQNIFVLEHVVIGDYGLLGDPDMTWRPGQIIDVLLPHSELLDGANDAQMLPKMRFVLDGKAKRAG